MNDMLFECRYKTELMAILIKHPKCSNFSVKVQDQITFSFQKGKKKASKTFSVVPGPEVYGDGRLKGKKITVAQGLGKDTKPDLVEPKQIETHTVVPSGNGLEGGIIKRKQPKYSNSSNSSNSTSSNYSRPTPSYGANNNNNNNNNYGANKQHPIVSPRQSFSRGRGRAAPPVPGRGGHRPSQQVNALVSPRVSVRGGRGGPPVRGRGRGSRARGRGGPPRGY